MKRYLNKIWLLVIGSWLLANSAFANGLVPCRGAGCTPCHVLLLIKNIANFLVRDVTAPLAGLLFLVGGIMMIAAGGSEERFKKGKQIFVNTAIGAFIVLASWAIVNTLIVTLGSNVEGFNVQNWWNVNCR
jgi:riboflavin transporter FmnP